MRQRYRWAANLATALGGAAGAALVVWLVVQAGGQGLDRNFLIFALLFVAGSALVPRLLVRLVWRLQRRRHQMEWG